MRSNFAGVALPSSDAANIPAPDRRLAVTEVGCRKIGKRWSTSRGNPFQALHPDAAAGTGHGRMGIDCRPGDILCAAMRAVSDGIGSTLAAGIRKKYDEEETL